MYKIYLFPMYIAGNTDGRQTLNNYKYQTSRVVHKVCGARIHYTL